MKKLRKYIIIALALCFVSCGTFTFKDTKEATVVASVGDEKLTLSEVQGLSAYGLTRSDTIQLVASYASEWVEQRLLQNYSKSRYASKSAEVERLVEDYRKALFMEFFEEEYTQSVGDNVTQEEVEDFYKLNRSKLVLSMDMVKAQMFVIPADSKDVAVLKKKLSSSAESEFQDLVSIAERDNFIVKDFSGAWIYFSDLLDNMPFRDKTEQMLKKNGVFEYEYENLIYFVKIIDRKTKGGIAPLETVEALIKREIVIRRKKEILSFKRDSIYSDALLRGDVEVINIF